MWVGVGLIGLTILWTPPLLAQRREGTVERAVPEAPLPDAPATGDVTLIKDEATMATPTPETPPERVWVTQAVARYLESLTDCGDKAQKNHWATDDPRFVRCVCPLALKWRLPKLAAPLLFHTPIVKGKNGLSLTVTPEGKASNCRVWVGAEPPPPPAEPAAAASPATLPVPATAPSAPPSPPVPTGGTP